MSASLWGLSKYLHPQNSRSFTSKDVVMFTKMSTHLRTVFSAILHVYSCDSPTLLRVFLNFQVEMQSFKEFECFLTCGWMTVDSLQWLWTATFAAHHSSQLMSHVDSRVNSGLDSTWQVVWVFWASDHDVDESLTSGCCHAGSICQLKCTVERMLFII